jgi:hypothetical protein
MSEQKPLIVMRSGLSPVQVFISKKLKSRLVVTSQ